VGNILRLLPVTLLVNQFICSTHGRDEKILVRKHEEKKPHRRLGVGGKKILE